MKLTLKNLCFSYDREPILHQVDCTFASGNFYSVIGPNGSGKTTLLDLISGFLKPEEGCILLDQTPLTELSTIELSRNIALVSQDHAINFPFSVNEVILMGRHPHIPRFSQPSDLDLEKVEWVKAVCGITHLQDRKVNELSGGERQRCVFARALCQDTPILLLDEAFSNMDINHTLQLLGMVKKSVQEQNKLVISVFHDLNLASAWSEAVLMLKDGQVKAFGNSQDVLTKETIREVFDVPAIVTFNEHVNAKQVCYPTI